MVMKNHPWRSVIVVAVVGVLFVIVSSGAGVRAQEMETVYITNPAEGSTVSGLVIVTGAVDFPDFMKYEVFLRTGDQMVWVATVYAPVINGNLARLDTRTFPDGIYQLIIRTVHTDSNYDEFVGPTFTIENNLGAPLPYPEVESSYLYPPVAGALARIKNCSGDNLEFDYMSPDGFCSAADLWIKFKAQDSPICPTTDVLLIPCEYRGTAIGQGQPRGATYSFVAEAGKIYELIYPGGDKLYINQLPGDERASTDTGGLDPDDPARLQPPPQITDETTDAPQSTLDTGAATSAPAAVAPTAPAGASDESKPMLPVSGQGRESRLPVAAAGVGFILLLVVGGVVAVRKRSYTT